MAQPLNTLAAESPAPPRLLLGDEAVAMAALDAGITSAYAYPGTPSTEIFETLIAEAPEGVTAHWCANEKTAYEQAIGASMAGVRVLVSMKHVGLNVAMDPFVNSGLLGIRGGLVIAVADDPGMHSSQNEQDSRILADFARVPCLEPADQQEAYDLVRVAFEASEALRMPVMIRLVTRLCHGRASVRRSEPLPRRKAEKSDAAGDWLLLPGNARRLWRGLLDRQDDVQRWCADGAGVGVLGAEEAAAADLGGTVARSPARGIITAGIARGYLAENAAELKEPRRHLHLSRYPVPAAVVRDFAEGLDEILVLEEGHVFIERHLRGLLPGSVTVSGRGSGALPEDGELTPDSVREALGLARRDTAVVSSDLPARPPQLCPGCPHRDAFSAVEKAVTRFPQWTVQGDIGCYALGALPPFRMLESCVCMGASIGMAKGMADAGIQPALAVIGDSTFLHSGVTPLMDAVAHDSPITVLILDNETVGMTGQQPTVLPDSRLEPIVLGVGVDPEHCHVVESHPKKVDDLAELLAAELAHPGVSVIIGVRECIVAARKRKAYEKRQGEAGREEREADGSDEPTAPTRSHAAEPTS